VGSGERLGESERGLRGSTCMEASRSRAETVRAMLRMICVSAAISVQRCRQLM
jgi:hypothetical protein